MAKPDLDDGYFRIAYELMAAVAAAGFNRGAQIVLFEVFAQIYGLARRKEAVLSPSILAGHFGMAKQNVFRAINELVASNVLVKLNETTYRFNKDYESWKLKETPDQRRARISFCKFSPILAKSFAYEEYAKGPGPHLPIDDGRVINSDDTHQSDKQKAVISFDYEPSSELITRPDQEESIGSNETQSPVEVASNDPAHVVFPPLTIPPVGTESLRLLPSAAAAPEKAGIVSDSMTEPVGAPLRSARFPGDSPETKLIAWARDTLGERCEHECFVSSLIPFMKSYPLDWVEHAILKAVAVNPDGLARYVNGTLAGWWPHGPERSERPPALNGTPHPVRKETPQERDRRISKGILDSADRIKALEEEL